MQEERKQTQDNAHTLVVEGRNAVLEAFRSGKPIDKVFVLDGCQDGPVRTIIREARKHDAIISFVSRERLNQLSETGKHQGVIAYAAAYEYSEVEDMIIPAQKYVNAQTTNNWYLNVGTDRYFKTSNPRIHPYVGAVAGFQMSRIETMEPYTGKYVVDADASADDDAEWVDQQVYLPAGKVGQIFGIKGALVAGVEYSLAKGLILGFECQPLAYRYDLIRIAPQGFGDYNLSHHNIKIVDMPVLKLGFRF